MGRVMSEVVIVKIRVEDLPRLADEMYMNTAYLKQVEAMIEKDDMVLFAAQKNGQYIGRCALWLAPADEVELREEIPGLPIVNALEVHPDFRHCGVGTSLMNALEDEARRRGFRQIALGVEPENEAARVVYGKRGYTYRKIGDADTYECFWLEVLPDGTEKKVTCQALLMTKELV